MKNVRVYNSYRSTMKKLQEMSKSPSNKEVILVDISKIGLDFSEKLNKDALLTSSMVNDLTSAFIRKFEIEYENIIIKIPAGRTMTYLYELSEETGEFDE